MLTVTVYTIDPAEGDVEGGLTASGPYEVDYVSLIDSGTHGPPSLVAPGRENGQNVKPRAKVGQSVLYINCSMVPAFNIERTSDDS